METRGRRGMEQTPESVAGLYEGAPTRTPERPPGTRIVQAFAHAQLTLTPVQMERSTGWYLTLVSLL